MEKKQLKPEEINFENVKQYIIELFYGIRDAWNSGSVNKEGTDLLANCFDGAPDGILGIQLLMNRLTGSAYSVVTDPNTGKITLVQDKPEDPKTIYEQANKLVDYVNNIVEKYKKTKSL